QLYSQLSDYNNDYLFTSNVFSNSLLAWWKFIKDEFNIESEIGVSLDSWNELYLNSNIYSAIFSELVCIISKYPKMVNRNANNDLHNPNGNAVEWGHLTEITKFNCYYLNGREMPSWLIEKQNDNEYFELFMKEENEDIKAGVITLIKETKGNEGLLKFLNAELVDENKIEHYPGYSEIVRLYKTKNKYSFLQDRFGNMNQPYCWSEMTCASTGNIYLIDNSADFTCSIEAIKFLRPSFVPQELKYQWLHSAS
ncbi:hypothetical protein M2T79_02470, partial [Elizabethkingia miricola]|uniref:hypothetical protein n=1 Tax=Elizabethkingia miricola TaxID=172045 RepID=UPI0020188CF5